MALIIGFENNSRKALAQLDEWPDLPPSKCAFVLPDEARGGDRVIWYVGGAVQKFVAIGKIEGRWSQRGAGEWNGVWRIGTTRPTRLPEFVPGERVANAAGLPIPKGPAVVEKHLERVVLRVLRGKPVDATSRAVEGAATESRSRQRNQSLREKVLDAAVGVCSACGTDFTSVADGLGRRCLVVHHTKQLRDYDQPAETKISDLAVLCANCHMMIHADSSKALSVKQLQQRLGVTT